jgi:hypothetical protein
VLMEMKELDPRETERLDVWGVRGNRQMRPAPALTVLGI